MFRMTALFVVERNKFQLLAELFKLLKLSAQASRHASLARGSRGGATKGTEHNLNFRLQVLVFGRVMLCCAVLCCAALCCAMLSKAMLCCAILCCAMVAHAVLCCAVLLHAVLCYAVLRCAVLCCPRLCCSMLDKFCCRSLTRRIKRNTRMDGILPPSGISMLARNSSSSGHSCMITEQTRGN